MTCHREGEEPDDMSQKGGGVTNDMSQRGRGA